MACVKNKKYKERKARNFHFRTLGEVFGWLQERRISPDSALIDYDREYSTRTPWLVTVTL